MPEISIFVCKQHFDELVNSDRKISIKRHFEDATQMSNFCDISECYNATYGLIKLEI
jgi:hypothetical protein